MDKEGVVADMATQMFQWPIRKSSRSLKQRSKSSRFFGDVDDNIAIREETLKAEEKASDALREKNQVLQIEVCQLRQCLRRYEVSDDDDDDEIGADNDEENRVRKDTTD